MHIVRAALPAAPTTMPRTCVRNVEGALPNIRFNVTNCTNQLHLVRRQTWVEHPDEQLHWRHGTRGPRPNLAQPRMNIAWGLGSTATTASHRKYIYIYIHAYLFIRRAPLATLCMARTMQRYAVGDVANNRTCNGGRVANTVWLPTWNGGSQPCNWQQAQSWCVQTCLANRDVDRCTRSVRLFVKACHSAIGRSWAHNPRVTCFSGELCAFWRTRTCVAS